MPQSIRLHLWVALMWCGVVAAAGMQIATSLAVGWWISSTTLPLVSLVAGVFAGGLASRVRHNQDVLARTGFQKRLKNEALAEKDPVREESYGLIQRCLEQLCSSRQVSLPNILLVPGEKLFAGIFLDKKMTPLVIVHPELPKQVSERDLFALMAHELRHICRPERFAEHLTLFVFYASILYVLLVWIGGGIVAATRLALGSGMQVALDGAVSLSVLVAAVLAVITARQFGRTWASRAIEYKTDALAVADLRSSGLGNELDYTSGLARYTKLTLGKDEHREWHRFIFRLLHTHPPTTRRIRVLHWIFQ